MFLEKIKIKMQSSSRIKNVLRVSSGTMLGQIISFITLPIFTRMYGAEIIGVWTVLQSLATIVNAFSDLGLKNVIMVVAASDYMQRVYQIITTISLFISALMGIGTFAYYTFFSAKDMIVSTWFIGIFIFIASFTLQQVQVCYTWLNRNGQYKILMKNPMITNLTFGISGVLFGLIGLHKYGYFLGWILGQLVTLAHMKRYLPKTSLCFSISTYKQIITEQKRFVIYQMPNNFIAMIKVQLPVLLIKAFFGTKILGYYSVTVRVLNIPISLLANAIGRVFFQTVTDMKRRGEQLGEFVYRNLTNVMKVAVIPMIVLITLGDVVVVWFLGTEWKPAGDFLRLLAFQNFFIFLMNTVFGISITLDKQNYSIISATAEIISITISLIIGYLCNNIYLGLGLMSALFIVINVSFFCALFKVMQVSRRKYLGHVLFYILLMLGVSFILRLFLLKLHIVISL